jgi:dihydroneopterin aldolase
LGDTNHHPQRIYVDLRLLGQNVEADWSSSLQKSTHYQSFSSTQNLGVKNWQLWSD